MTNPVDVVIENLPDWRGNTLAKVRDLITAADPEIVEEVKRRKAFNPLGVPTWSRAGIICTGEVYKDKVKLTFFRGASLRDDQGLFNTPPSGTRFAIDLRQDDTLNVSAFTALVREAIDTIA